MVDLGDSLDQERAAGWSSLVVKAAPERTAGHGQGHQMRHVMIRRTRLFEMELWALEDRVVTGACTVTA